MEGSYVMEYPAFLFVLGSTQISVVSVVDARSECARKCVGSSLTGIGEAARRSDEGRRQRIDVAACRQHLSILLDPSFRVFS